MENRFRNDVLGSWDSLKRETRRKSQYEVRFGSGRIGSGLTVVFIIVLHPEKPVRSHREASSLVLGGLCLAIELEVHGLGPAQLDFILEQLRPLSLLAQNERPKRKLRHSIV